MPNTKVVNGGRGGGLDSFFCTLEQGYFETACVLLQINYDFDTILCCSSHQADAFMKAYPNFVNFFENTKETIIKCDQNNPRFHAFLKVCGWGWSCAMPGGHGQRLWREIINN